MTELVHVRDVNDLLRRRIIPLVGLNHKQVDFIDKVNFFVTLLLRVGRECKHRRILVLTDIVDYTEALEISLKRGFYVRELEIWKHRELNEISFTGLGTVRAVDLSFDPAIELEAYDAIIYALCHTSPAILARSKFECSERYLIWIGKRVTKSQREVRFYGRTNKKPTEDKGVKRNVA